MSIRASICSVELIEGSVLLCKVTAFDDSSAEIELTEKMHNLESWRKVSQAITDALVLMELSYEPAQ